MYTHSLENDNGKNHCCITFHRFRGYTEASQLTICPSSSPSSCPKLSSVAVNKFFRDSWTSPAVFSLRSRDGRAAFFGGDA